MFEKKLTSGKQLDTIVDPSSQQTYIIQDQYNYIIIEYFKIFLRTNQTYFLIYKKTKTKNKDKKTKNKMKCFEIKFKI